MASYEHRPQLVLVGNVELIAAIMVGLPPPLTVEELIATVAPNGMTEIPADLPACLAEIAAGPQALHRLRARREF